MPPDAELEIAAAVWQGLDHDRTSAGTAALVWQEAGHRPDVVEQWWRHLGGPCATLADLVALQRCLANVVGVPILAETLGASVGETLSRIQTLPYVSELGGDDRTLDGFRLRLLSMICEALDGVDDPDVEERLDDLEVPSVLRDEWCDWLETAAAALRERPELSGRLPLPHTGR